jgi:site-specific recombinase XerD
MPTTLAARPYTRSNDNFLESFSLFWKTKRYADSTLKEYVRHLRLFEQHIDRSFLAVEQVDIERYLAGMLGRLSAGTAAYATRAIRKFYWWLAKDGHIDTNPAKLVPMPQVPEPVTKMASSDEIKALLRNCRDDKMFAGFNDVRDAALIHVFRSTGVRIGEAARMKLEHIDVANGLILIPTSKTRSPRTVRLDPRARRAMSKYLRRLDQSCPDGVWRSAAGKHLSLDGVKQIVERRAKAAGVAVSAHQLRRSMATDWLSRGGSETALQTLVGWSSNRMVARYTKQRAAELAFDEHCRLYDGR